MSMSKATEATAAIKAAWAAVSELTVPVAISQSEVHVLGYRALEQIPGETVHRQIGQGRMAAHEMSRTLDGVRFYCLLTQRDYEGLEGEG